MHKLADLIPSIQPKIGETSRLRQAIATLVNQTALKESNGDDEEGFADYPKATALKRFVYGSLFPRCESHIEVLLGAYLYAENEGQHEALVWDDNLAWDKAKRGIAKNGVVWGTQCAVGPYRADFLFRVTHSFRHRWLVVECDGKEWHQDNPQQAERDSKRDYEMARRHIRVQRFTGLDIWRNPVDCATRIRTDLRVLDLKAELQASGG